FPRFSYSNRNANDQTHPGVGHNKGAPAVETQSIRTERWDTAVWLKQVTRDPLFCYAANRTRRPPPDDPLERIGDIGIACGVEGQGVQAVSWRGWGWSGERNAYCRCAIVWINFEDLTPTEVDRQHVGVRRPWTDGKP